MKNLENFYEKSNRTVWTTYRKLPNSGLRVLIPIILNVLDASEIQGRFGKIFSVEKTEILCRKLKFCVPNFSANKIFQKQYFFIRYLRNFETNGSVENTRNLCFPFQLHDPSGGCAVVSDLSIECWLINISAISSEKKT